jgi:hypothetical protein
MRVAPRVPLAPRTNYVVDMAKAGQGSSHTLDVHVADPASNLRGASRARSSPGGSLQRKNNLAAWDLGVEPGRDPTVQLELPLGLADEERRPGTKKGRARWVADRAVDAIRDRFGWKAVRYAPVVLGIARSVPDEFRQLGRGRVAPPRHGRALRYRAPPLRGPVVALAVRRTKTSLLGGRPTSRLRSWPAVFVFLMFVILGGAQPDLRSVQKDGLAVQRNVGAVGPSLKCLTIEKSYP